jgi:hypothetical protein
VKLADVSVFFFLLSLLGCSTSHDPHLYTAAELFPVKPGDSWVMENKLGDQTYYDIENAPSDAACETGDHFIMHVSKSAARTYWGDGIPEAEDRELFSRDANGEIRGLADIPKLPESCPWCNGATSETINWRPVSGEALPYITVPAQLETRQVIHIPTHYQGYIEPDVNTTACVALPANYYTEVRWESDFYVEQVDTPAYRGPAVVSEQFEGNGSSPVHEKWYFAPNVGLVQVDSFLTGGDPTEMMALQAEYGSDVITIQRIPGN